MQETVSIKHMKFSIQIFQIATLHRQGTFSYIEHVFFAL